MIYVPIKIIVVSIVILVLPEGRWSIFMVDLIKNYIDLQGYDGNIMGYNDLRLTSISCSNCSNQQKIGILRGIDLDRWSLTDDWGRHVA